ncbi:MAG TPA: DUF2723 domain-containing protein [Flavobacteriales bacterium]
MSYNKLNVLTGWIVWAIATVVYVLTLEPTMPFWDCGEFIASAYKLEVGHPPGAPLFMMIGRVFSLFAGSPEQVPYMINMMSGLCSSFTILFLFWSITHMAKKLALVGGNELTTGKTIAIMGSGIVGALAYTFSDSFWFSAVEGEVYAMSSLFTAVVFWAILKWEAVTDEGGELRWIILIAYLMGLSIGVHLLNLLAIPAICFVYYFKKYEYSLKGFIYTGIISLALLGLIQIGVIIWFVQLAGWFERTFVNTLGLPFNVGSIFYALLVVGLLTYGLWYTYQKRKVVLNTLILGITVAILGYTSFAAIIIRSQANPPMDENNPENLFALLAYLNREQYGDRPLLFGQYFNTPTDIKQPYKDGANVWVKSYSVREDNSRNTLVLSSRNKYTAEQYIQNHPDKKLKLVQEYIESGEKKGSVPNYRKEFSGFFPRMYSSQANHINEYKQWSNYQDWNTEKGRSRVESAEQLIKQYEYALNYYSQTNRMPPGMEDTDIQSVIRSLDRMTEKMIPTFGEDMRYFTNYQLGWMYFRYFMWNFVGRQNDVQGHGSFTDGNWLSGVNLIDEAKLGNRKQLPEEELNNKGFNKYYFIPLILGFIGLIFQLLRHPKDFTVVTLLFILTGIAIVVYLNQTPLQPRERDYAYAGSFYAFAIWVGLAVYALYYAATNLSYVQLGKMAAMTLGGSALILLMEKAVDGTMVLGYSLMFMSLVSCAMFAIMAILNATIKGESSTKAILATVLCLSAPYLMGYYNWDDHNRAKRETGIAMAINYLESLQPNAIIFTNGDNDTFPLWYAQEVEGIRTDVRVVNLSLLNTDWYIDQMKRKQYESDPVPFKMPEEKYRQGTRDVLFLDPNRETKGYMPVAEAVKAALDDSKFIVNGRSKISYVPTYQFSMPVPDEVKESYRKFLQPGDSLVSSITWSITDASGKPKNFITKAQLAVLDLLANMDWNRPVYFAVTTGGDAYMGLERYFQLEGLAYRLTPIYHKENQNPNIDGGVGTDIMYENMMTKFQWGNMDKEDIYLDENNRRMTTNLRLQFGHLAEQLIEEGKLDSAKAVLHKSLEVMPEKNVPYEQPQIMWQVADMLYQAGDSIKALELTKRLVELNDQHIRYFESLDPARRETLMRETRMRIQVNDRLTLLAKDYFPNDPEVEAMYNNTQSQLENMGMMSYETYLDQQRQMNELKRIQDSLDKARGGNAIEIGADGSIRRN